MSVLKYSSIAAALSALSLPVQAEGIFNLEPAPSSFYVSGFGGASFLSDTNFGGVSDPVAGIPGPTGVAGVPLDVALDYSSSYTFGGAVGYQLPFTYLGYFQPRLELEVSYLENDINAGSFNGGAQTFSGDQDALFFYLNNYSDIRFSADQRFVPYIGGGLGIAVVNSNVGYFPASATAPTFGVFGEDTAFAGHFAVGASYELNDNIELYSEGRYFRIQNVKLDRRFIGGGADLFNATLEEDIDGFTVTGGLRYRF